MPSSVLAAMILLAGGAPPAGESEPRQTADAAPPITAPPKTDREYKLLRLRQKPAFSGNGLLLASGVLLSGSIGSAVALSLLRTEESIICVDPEETYCHREGDQTFGRSMAAGVLTLSSLTGIAFGISGSVARGRYDAWRSLQGHTRPWNAKRAYVAGSVLAATGALVGITTFALWQSKAALKQRWDDAYPVLWAGSATALTAGTGLIGYTGSYTARRRKIEKWRAGLLLDRDTGAVGLRFRGQF